MGFLIYGKQGSGKSSLALEFMKMHREDGKPFRVLYIDSEAGSVDSYLDEYEAQGINVDNIYLLYTQSLKEVNEYITKVTNNEDLYELDDEGNETDEVVLDADGEPFRADAIVVDGTTILNLTAKQGLVEFSKKRNKVKADKDGLVGDARLVKIEGAGMELKDYQTINFKGQDLILDLMASGVHYIVTARETDEKQTIKQADGTTMSVVTGKKIPDGFKGMAYNTKTEIRMFRNEDGTVCAHIKKDRTHTHADNSIVEDPTLLDWQSVIDKTADKKSFVVKNDLTKAVDVEQDIYSKEILGKVGEPDMSESDNNVSSSTNTDIEALKKEIIARRNALPPIEKKAMKEKLEVAGLPTAYKNVTDVEILKKVLEMFE